ncbi:MAG: hypothetical protein GY820_36300 [Gammaproteobacteria bacterium]|nr:hypothetical protein [Gammaproteobacteria bacterium]
MKTILKYITIGLLLFVVGAGYLYAHVVHAATISYSNFEKHDERIYIDNLLKNEEKKNVLLLLKEAENRIIKSFGEYTATPKIIVVSTDKGAKKYGLGGSPGIVHIAPWEQYMIININKSGIDVIAHELLHTEVTKRLGYLIWQIKMPVWLNEGIGMQVDYRQQYKNDNKRISAEEFSKIVTLQKSSDFWSNDREQNIENYRLSKAAVSEILKHSGNKSMYSMLTKIKEGESAHLAFRVEETNKLLHRKKDSLALAFFR